MCAGEIVVYAFGETNFVAFDIHLLASYAADGMISSKTKYVFGELKKYVGMFADGSRRFFF